MLAHRPRRWANIKQALVHVSGYSGRELDASCIHPNEDPVVNIYCADGETLAVSSSPRPWIDVFASSEKSNMAVTESDPDPRSEKCP